MRLVIVLMLLTGVTSCAAKLDAEKRASQMNFRFSFHDYNPQESYEVFFRTANGAIQQKSGFIRKSTDPNSITLLSQDGTGFKNSEIPVSNIVLVLPGNQLKSGMDTNLKRNIAIIAVGSVLVAGLVGAIFYVNSR